MIPPEPPELSTRVFTDDQFVLDKVFYSNCYQIKGFKEGEEQPVVVDIGAHAGFFAFSAFALGAKKIHCVEPFFPNFKQLIKNTSSIGADMILYYNFGIYTKDTVFRFNYPEVQKGIFSSYSDIDIDIKDRASLINFVVPLDAFLKRGIDEETVDILKISIGYAEIDILENSSLEKVVSICGETNENAERIEQFKQKMSEKGFINFFVAQNKEEENKYTFLLSKVSIDKHFNIQKS